MIIRVHVFYFTFLYIFQLCRPGLRIQNIIGLVCNAQISTQLLIFPLHAVSLVFIVLRGVIFITSCNHFTLSILQQQLASCRGHKMGKRYSDSVGLVRNKFWSAMLLRISIYHSDATSRLQLLTVSKIWISIATQSPIKVLNSNAKAKKMSL